MDVGNYGDNDNGDEEDIIELYGNEENDDEIEDGKEEYDED